MAIEEEYKEGLDALLSGKINIDEVLELGGKVLYCAAYILPGVGIYRQFKKPRGERNILGIIGFSAYTIPFVIKVAYLGAWAITGEWNPVTHFKNIFTEKKIEPEQNKLEKTIMYEEAIKPLEK